MRKPTAYDVIRSPVITEKATMASEASQVIFNVAATATKPQIKAAVEQLFNVKVKAVNTLVRKGKKRRSGAGWRSRVTRRGPS
jgi:large subunit ribosomal protein L23